MHGTDLILTLAAGLGAALVLGYGTQRLGLSPIVGYLLAGIAIGPSTPGFVANQALADQLAEVGVILLMFGVGLQFHIRELLEVRRVAVPGAIGQSLAATGLGCLVGWWAGWSWSAGLIYGLSISVASTVVLVRVLSDRNDLHTRTGHIAVGWLVMEDLLSVVALVLLPALYGPARESAGGVIQALGEAALKLGFLFLFTLVVGGQVIPWLLDRIAATRSRELFTLAVLVVALGIAVGAATLFGASMALGAFLAGLVVGRSEFSTHAASEALPMRDAFAVLFFVSVGMLLDPDALLEGPGLAIATLGIVLLGKPLAAIAITLWLGHPLRTCLALGVVLGQVGEFTFILAALGTDLEILDAPAMNSLVAASIVSIAVNPLWYRSIDALEALARRSSRLSRWLGVRTRARPGGADRGEPRQSEAAAVRHSAVVVGYGPVGHTVAGLLRDNDIEPTVIELNVETLRRLRAEGRRAVLGDATHRDVLQEAGVERAVVLILSASGIRGGERAIGLARELNPRIRVFARVNYVREASALRRAGADVVFSGEGEVALSITEVLLRELGATAEQIDRERDRVRSTLQGEARTS